MKSPSHLEQINHNAAGIDLGSTEHWVCVNADKTEKNVRRFGCFTPDLIAMADWLIECGVTTVAMEATGVYWILVFQVLEKRGLEVKLVNAHHVKTVPGRKTDVNDCQWLQQLHTYGLLSGSFRPEDLSLRSPELYPSKRELNSKCRYPRPKDAKSFDSDEPTTAQGH